MARRIKLNDGDSAVVVREDGSVEFVVPNHGEDDGNIPESELLVIGISMALHDRDQRLIDLVWKVWEEKQDHAKTKAH